MSPPANARLSPSLTLLDCRYSSTPFPLGFGATMSAPFMQAMLGFRWRDLAIIYLRSLVATAAAVAPVLAGYRLWAPAAEAGALQMLVTAGSGVLLWLAALRLSGHPLLAEITGLLGELRTALRRSRAQAATP
jgi:hypothetical protein